MKQKLKKLKIAKAKINPYFATNLATAFMRSAAKKVKPIGAKK